MRSEKAHLLGKFFLLGLQVVCQVLLPAIIAAAVSSTYITVECTFRVLPICCTELRCLRSTNLSRDSFDCSSTPLIGVAGDQW
jgi:hypothetical protein